jgi:hypothetical protein
MRHVALLGALLLTGCFEAMDLVQERLAAPDMCPTPNGIALCDPAYQPPTAMLADR